MSPRLRVAGGRNGSTNVGLGLPPSEAASGAPASHSDRGVSAGMSSAGDEESLVPPACCRGHGRGLVLCLLLCGDRRRTRRLRERVGFAPEEARSTARRWGLPRSGRRSRHPVDRHHLPGAVRDLLHRGRSSEGIVVHPIFERVERRMPEVALPHQVPNDARMGCQGPFSARLLADQ